MKQVFKKSILIKLVFLVYILFPKLCFSDALPKGYELYDFQNCTSKVDSIIVLQSDFYDFSEFDTVYFNPNWKVVVCSDNKCGTNGDGFKEFRKVIAFSDGRMFASELFTPEGSNPSFKIYGLKNGFDCVETTNFFFKGIKGEILRALTITLIIELLTGLVFFKRRKKTFLVILLVNSLTLPIAWLAFPYLNAYLGSSEVALTTIILEIIILFLEFFLYSKFLNQNKRLLILYVLIANGLSFFLGGFIYLVTVFI